MRINRRALAHGDQFEKGAGELDDAVFRTPRMAIACADQKAETLIKCSRRFEIMDGENEVIEGASGSY